MDPIEQFTRLQTRHQFFAKGKHLLGGPALATLLGNSMAGKAFASPVPELPMPHFPAKAKRVIYLHMVGGPSQMDLFDYKPKMAEWYDKELPESIRKGQRLTTMTSGQKRFPIAPSKYSFKQRGECGMWMNDSLLPYLGTKADEICWMKSLHTEAINHEPAIAAMQTGNEITGRPCLGSWASYGLGSEMKTCPPLLYSLRSRRTVSRNRRSLPGFGVLVTCPENTLVFRFEVTAIRFCTSRIRPESRWRFANDPSMGSTV